MSSLKEFGRKVSCAQVRLHDEARIVKHAESLLFNRQGAMFQPATNPPVGIGSPGRVAAIAAIAAIAAVVLVLITAGFLLNRFTSTRPLTVTVNGRPTGANEGVFMSDPKAKETTIDFSDGSRVKLEKNTRGRFTDVTSNGAGLLVEEGRLAADIAHLNGADWRFLAGPFEVRVTGTKFTLSWDRQQESLSVVMESGSVEVSGPSPDETRSVKGGETFRADMKTHRVEVVPSRKPIDDQSVTMPSTLGPNQESALEKPQALRTSDEDSDDAHTAPLQDRTSDSKTESTKPPGDLCGESSPTESLAEADAARLSGDTVEAAKQYAKIRRCIPQSSAAVFAAFNLGKIAFDNRKDWSGAARWLEIYLKEQRGEGPVREALGRLMEVYVNGQKLEKAKAAARRYLAEYPKGPHAAYATSLLEEDTDSTAVP